MADDVRADASAFAGRLDALVRSRTEPGTGRAWTNRSLSAALGRRGHAISHATIGRLRRGQSDARQADLEALADILDVPVSYFFPTVEDGQDERRLLDAMAAYPQVRAIAMRLADQGPISEQAASAIISMIDHIEALDRAAPRGPAQAFDPDSPVAGG